MVNKINFQCLIVKHVLELKKKNCKKVVKIHKTVYVQWQH